MDGLLSQEAYQIGQGYYTGPTFPSHRGDTYGGVKHKDYNTLVQQVFTEYAAKNGINKDNPISGKQMQKFIDEYIIEGKADPRLKAFNTAVKEQAGAYRRLKGIKDGLKNTYEEILKRGKEYVRTPPWVSSKLGIKILGVFGTLGGLAVSESVTFADVAGNPDGYYKKGLRLLDEGKLEEAMDAFLGSERRDGTYGFYDELVDGGGGLAALRFKTALLNAYLEAFEAQQAASALPVDPAWFRAPSYWEMMFGRFWWW